MSKYNILHLHTDYSNGITSIDSVTKFNSYIERAKQEGMTAMAFTEHGCIFDWYKKKECCEANGIKYIHGIEMYITKTLDEKIRDNYHCCMYSKNYDGFLELNKLISKGFNRENGSYYYAPRITVEDLLNTSDNIIITSACLGGFFASKDQELENIILDFMTKNKHRCFLEIQHHIVKQQMDLNLKLYNLHLERGIELIVGTDTHALNDKHAKGRVILQKAKNIYFENEEGWDITFKSYDELIDLFKKQNIIPEREIKRALNNTIVLSDMVEEFSIDKSYKYPKLYENGLEVLKQKINNGILNKRINKLPNYKSEYIPRIKYELNTYIHNGAVDFLLLDEDIKSWARSKNIFPGYSRGSVSGSEIAYIIGMTDIDSIKHNMNFERFMNTERVSLADVDTDWQPNHREIVKDYIYNKKGLYCADIVTFNTVALKGSIRDVGRALEIPLKEINEICANIENSEDEYRKKYKELFEYVDIINGTIVSIGTHPCGTIVSPIPLDDSVGLCSISTCKHPVSMLSMKCIDAQNFTKLDILGLENIQLINEVCELVGIERLTPDNVPDEEVVWRSMADNNLLIFQWESDSAGAFLKTLLSDNTLKKIKEVNPNFRYLDLVSMGNGAIRPAGASYRNALSNGEFRDNGHKALNDFLSPTMGYLVYQEQILEFLHKFCGFTMGEADIVRRGFAKKTGTEQFIPRIKDGFIKTMKEKFGVEKTEAEKLIINFLQVIEDASSYLFSLNHSEPYTYIGYIAGWLRYYYPLEFITVSLNINQNDQEKTAKIIDYANKKSIKILNAKYGYSKGKCFFNKETNSIYKGIASIKNLNEKVGEELYNLSKKNKYETFIDLLIDIQEKTSCNSRQLEILIKLDFFDAFGKSKKLLTVYKCFQILANKKSPKIATIEKNIPDVNLIRFIKDNSTPTQSTYGKLNWYKALIDISNNIRNNDIDFKDKLGFQNDILGYIDYKNSKLSKRYALITSINTKYTPVADTYCLNNGVVCRCKISKKYFREKELSENDTIFINKMERRFGYKKVGEDSNGKPKFEQDQNKIEWWITDYNIVNIDEVLND